MEEHFLKNVGTLDCPNSAVGSFSLLSENAYPVITYEGQILAACSIVGKGRAFAFGHDLLFKAEHLAVESNKIFLINIIRWLVPRKKEKLSILMIGGSYKYIGAILKEYGINNSVTDVETTNGINITQFDIIGFGHIGSIPHGMGVKEFDELDKYLKNGGAIMTGSEGWVWKHYGDGKTPNTTKTLEKDFFSNKVFRSTGISFIYPFVSDPKMFFNIKDSSVEYNKNSQSNVYEQYNPQIIDSQHSSQLIEYNQEDPHSIKSVIDYIARFTEGIANSSVNANFLNQGEEILEVLLYGNFAPTPTSFPPKIVHDFINAYNQSQYVPKPYIGNERSTVSDFIHRFLHTITSAFPPEYIKPFAPSFDFPGLCKSAVCTKELDLELGINQIVFTGLYANPGQILRVFVQQASILEHSIDICIGFGDDLTEYTDPLKRFPITKNSYPISSKTLTICSPHGGVIYLSVPKSNMLPKTISLKFEGVIITPYYNERIHKPTEFPGIQKYPGAWAIIETKRMAFVFQATEYFRSMTNIAELCNFWNRVFDCYTYLSNKPPSYEKQVLYSDIQICLGYMHSGNPIMTHDDVVDNYLGINGTIFREGNWGIYHEIGHNHQESSWTFDGVVEVTVNIFTLYVMNKIHGIKPLEHKWLEPEESFSRMKEYFSKGSNFTEWMDDYQLGLLTYALLIDEFGFDSIRTAFIKYQTDYINPAGDYEKISKWVEVYSSVIKRNLSQYFKKWGWPVENLSNLKGPTYMHRFMTNPK